MKNNIHYWEISIGFIGQMVLILFCWFIINLGINVHWAICLIVLIPIGLMTAIDSTKIDVEKMRYRSGTFYFFYLSKNQWTGLTNDCFLKIEPISKTTSFDSPRINHGSMSKIETALYLRNSKLKHKCYLEQGKYDNIILRAKQYSNKLGIRVVDYKTLRKK